MHWSAARVGVVVALLILGVTLLTTLYDPLKFGEDQSEVTLVVFAAVLIGLGASAPTRWVFVVPVGLSIGIAPTAWGTQGAFVVLVGIPVGLALTAVGYLTAKRWLDERWALVAGPLLVLAAAPAAWAASEQIDRANAETLPAAAQARLPLDGPRVENLCDAELPLQERVALTSRFDFLIEEIERHPDALVAYLYRYSDGPDVTKDITVREVGEELRDDIEHSPGAGCAGLREQLDAALG